MSPSVPFWKWKVKLASFVIKINCKVHIVAPSRAALPLCATYCRCLAIKANHFNSCYQLQNFIHYPAISIWGQDYLGSLFWISTKQLKYWSYTRKYLRKYRNTMGQYISYLQTSRNPMIQLGRSSFWWRVPQQMLRKHRSLEAYCATLW
jgi:hypothetical protein